MNLPIHQHLTEIERNREAWQHKPLLREVYAQLYRRILRCVDARLPGPILEVGSGQGQLKPHLPRALCSDLFPNPWLDLVCDGYELPFADRTLSHLVLLDVFHHLQAPRRFLNEARRVLRTGGRLILLEPYISWASFPVFGWFHPEGIGWWQRIETSHVLPPPRRYYTGQGHATRVFFRRECPGLLEGWTVKSAEAFACFAYLLSGGFSRPALYPASWLPWLNRLDGWLSGCPRIFAGRCLVVLTNEETVKVKG